MNHEHILEEDTITSRMKDLSNPAERNKAYEDGYPQEARKIQGISYSDIRALGYEYAKENDWRNIVDNVLNEDSFEEILLKGLITGLACDNLEEAYKRYADLIEKLDSNRLCDNFCLLFRPAINHPNETLNFLLPYFHSSNDMDQRFAIVTLLDHYINVDYIGQVLDILKKISKSARPTIQETWRWAARTCFLAFPLKTLNMLEASCFKTDELQQIIDYFNESPRINDVRKRMLDDFFIRNI